MLVSQCAVSFEKSLKCAFSKLCCLICKYGWLFVREDEQCLTSVDGELALTASNLTSRKWNGILAIYSDPEFAPAAPHIDVGTETEAGNSDIIWLDERRLLVASDSGAVDLWTVLSDGSGIENSISYLEHNDVCSSISVNNTKQQVVSGSWDSR